MANFEAISNPLDVAYPLKIPHTDTSNARDCASECLIEGSPGQQVAPLLEIFAPQSDPTHLVITGILPGSRPDRKLLTINRMHQDRHEGFGLLYYPSDQGGITVTGFDIAVFISVAAIGLVAVLYVRWASEQFDKYHNEDKNHPTE